MIIGFYGKQGSGKTLLAVRSVLKSYTKYENVYSNIKIFAIDHKDFDAQFFEDLTELKLKNSLILFDEIQEYMNARKFMSNLNMDYGTFIRQVRKLGNTLVWTSQFVYQVDKVLRSNTDNYIKVHSNYEGFNKKDVDLDKLAIWYEIFDMDAEGFMNLVSTKQLNSPSDFVNQYDSSQIVKNEVLDKNGECKYFLNMLCNELEGKYKTNFKAESYKDLCRFAKMVRTDIFKIYKIKNRSSEKIKNLTPIG